jgi:hypothetical protein
MAAAATTSSGSLLALVLVLAGCSRDDVEMCTMELRPSIDVEVRDSVTGAPIAAQASAVARWKAFVDTLHPARVEGGATISLAGIPDRPGRYTLTIEAPGYQTWEKTGVVVRKGKCHVETVKLVARLQPKR